MPPMPTTLWIIAALLLTNITTFGLWRHAVGEQDELVAKTELTRVQNALEEASEAATRNLELVGRLHERNRQIEAEKREKEDALRKVTVGRPCLSAPAVRVLNTSLSMPEAKSDSISADAAFATDTDVAEWANDAIAQYDLCRNNLDRIAEFYR